MIINLEGNDGAGKSTVIGLIREYYENIGKKIKHIHFPMYGHSEFSMIISKFLQGEYGDINNVDPLFIANIYAMDRYMYKDKLINHIKENDIILLDRYVYSNLAFQGAKILDMDKRFVLINWIKNFEFNFLNLPFPDYIFYLDVPMGTIQERLDGNRMGGDRGYLNGKKDIHENDMGFQKRVQEVYRYLCKNQYGTIIKTYDEDNKILSPVEILKKIKEKI